MADPSTAFVGAVPANYDRHLGPILFHHYADDLVARLSVTPGMRVLETACGTGIVTRCLVDRIRARGTLVATDLNQAMIDHGRTKLPDDATVEWQAADATGLPFPDRSFDAVVCQFGLMFFPDKAAGLQQALRVMKRRPEALPEIKTALARQIARQIGDHPVRCALRAHVFTAYSPAG